MWRTGGEISAHPQLLSPGNQQSSGTATAPQGHLSKWGAEGEQNHPNNTGGLPTLREDQLFEDIWLLSILRAMTPPRFQIPAA